MTPLVNGKDHGISGMKLPITAFFIQDKMQIQMISPLKLKIEMSFMYTLNSLHMHLWMGYYLFSL